MQQRLHLKLVVDRFKCATTHFNGCCFIAVAYTTSETLHAVFMHSMSIILTGIRVKGCCCCVDELQYCATVLTAVDQQEMTSAAADDSAMFMDNSVNESPYFVHEPSSSSNVKNSAKVSHATLIILSVCCTAARYSNGSEQ